MTKNRAAKIAARTIAATQDIRHPEATYRDDRRKLRLPDGTEHNFADGALQSPTRNDDAHRLWVAHIMREAANKGWRLFQHGGHTASEAAAAIEALQAAGPALILIHPHFWVELEGDAYKEMARNGHQALNILISWLPRGCTVDPAPWESRYPALDVRRTAARSESTPAVAPATETELLKARIAFARRYADIEEMGVDTAGTLDALAADMQALGTEAAASMAAACEDAAKGVRHGLAREELWGPHRPLLGAHMVRMLILSADVGSTAKGLRMTAETLEAELRIGMAA